MKFENKLNILKHKNWNFIFEMDCGGLQALGSDSESSQGETSNKSFSTKQAKDTEKLDENTNESNKSEIRKKVDLKIILKKAIVF